MWRNKILLLSFLIVGFTLTVIHAKAQNGISSPYTAYGIGYLSEINNIQNRSMGGIGIGTRNNFTINIKNPASYSAFDSTSFVFDAGIAGSYTTLKTEELTEQMTTGTISHLLFGFPIVNWWRSSFGLIPYSSVGYDVSAYSYDENIGNVNHSFEGSGGITEVFWGNSIRPFKKLSLGVNASYLFGTIDKTQDVSFPDSTYYFSTNISDAISVSDFYFEFGFQFHTKIKERYNLVVGGTYNPSQDISAKRNYTARSYFGELNGIKNYKDTIAYTSDLKGAITLPESYGIGFSFSRNNKWLFGLDYKFEKWSDYSVYGVKDSLVDSHCFAFGGHITPNFNSNSYLKRIEYRFGAHYNLSYLSLREQDLDGFGITFGVGLPIKRVSVSGAYSMLNIGIKAGRRGTMKNGLIQENYVEFYLGVSLYEWWFFKRRYN